MSAPLTARSLYKKMLAGDDADFLVRPEQRALGYARFSRDVRGCCALFRSRRMETGDRVLIVTADEGAAITAFVAALLDGLVPVILAPDTSAARAAAVAATVESRIVIADAARMAEAWARDALPVDPPARGRFGRTRAASTGFHAAMAAAEDDPRLPELPDALAYLLFTSGTTSAPKGVMITHGNVFSHLATLSRLFEYGPHSRIFNGLVLAHGDGLVQGPLLALANGCALLRPEPFAIARMETWLNTVRALRATDFISVPTVYSFIDRYAAHGDYFDAPEFRSLTSVAAKLDEGLWRRLEKRFKRPVFNHYGLTETTTSGLYAGPLPALGPVGTIGRPVDMRARIVGADGNAALDGEAGELWLSGSNVFTGYWRDPDHTDAALAPDGWLRTGDLAVKRPDGAYEIRGRIKTVILSGGLLIMPEEIDETLIAHPAVAEAATIGIADTDFGEIAVSAVVLDRPVEEASLIEHCRVRLEAMKVPKRIVAVKHIPRGGAGKPRLEELRALLQSQAVETGMGSRVSAGVLEVASAVFRVPLGILSLDTSPAVMPAWDSFAHIALVLQAEERFGIRIATAEVAAIRNLHDLAAAIERGR